MPNDSASGGYLTPVSPPPATDANLADVLQQAVVGITGLAGEMVRPRWQPKPPPQPHLDTDWCAIGVAATIPEAGRPGQSHIAFGEGTTVLRRTVILEVLASFYGPNAEGYATYLADGLFIDQNLEALTLEGIGLVDVDRLVNASDLQSTTFRRRIDLPFRLRRRVDRTFVIQNVTEASGIIHALGASGDATAERDEPLSVKDVT